MAFNFLGGLSSLLPGYVEGREKAIRSNFQDMKDYNQVQQGQVSNLYDIATFSNNVERDNIQTELANLTADRNFADMVLYWMGFPGQMAQQQAFSMSAPFLFPMMYGGQINQYRHLLQNPALGARMPSVIG